ncbi:MAG: hypothetical protein O7E53_01615 [Alphaproteobacteria bacterium]|nr:hypothetical protein [Alphaproteobacteria bacterium]
MTAPVFKFPATPEGRQLLKDMLPAVRNGRLPDGMPIAGQDWDALAVQGARELEEYERWRKEQEGGGE